MTKRKLPLVFGFCRKPTPQLFWAQCGNNTIHRDLEISRLLWLPDKLSCKNTTLRLKYMMSPFQEIDSLKDENARLKGIVTRLERRDADRGGNLAQSGVESRALRLTVRNKEIQISALHTAVETKDQLISSQAEEIEKLRRAANVAHHQDPVEHVSIVQRLEADLAVLAQKVRDNDVEFEGLRVMMMPCYQVGYWIRQRNSQNGNTSWFAQGITCDCTTHGADPLADASILHYDVNLQLVNSSGTDQWAHYEQSYGVPPDIVLNKPYFRRFLDLIAFYRNMECYGQEGSTPPAQVAAFMDETKKLVEKVYPLGIFKCDEDIEKDESSIAMYNRLALEFHNARTRHRTFPRKMATGEQ